MPLIDLISYGAPSVYFQCSSHEYKSFMSSTDVEADKVIEERAMVNEAYGALIGASATCYQFVEKEEHFRIVLSEAIKSCQEKGVIFNNMSDNQETSG